MSTSTTPAFENSTRLVTDDPNAHPYVFIEHTVAPGHTTPFLCAVATDRTYVVIDGSVEVEDPGSGSTTTVERLSGWHAPSGSLFRIRAVQAAVIVEAGVVAGEVREWPEDLPAPAGAGSIEPVSGYTVTKPWGHEVWYTANLTEPAYALKQIHMNAGNQSSLQSHRAKAETNYVVDGEATVLNGLPAPDDVHTVIDPGDIPMQVHGVRTGWSSAPGILHRVIAQRDYTAIEVSTPELDDVIRWQDDSGRSHGRVDAEHGRTQR